VTAPPDEVSEHAGFDMLNAELTSFARAIRDRKPYSVPIEEVLHGMAVFDAIVRAGKSGQVEPVAEPPRRG
jgi:predicted dehydrogenase